MSRRVSLHPSKVEPDTDVVVFEEDGCYLILSDAERRKIINWIKHTCYSSYEGYDDIMYTLQGREKPAS